MRRILSICIAGLILFSTGCGHRPLLEEPIDADAIDRVLIVMFMGDYDRRDAKSIVDETEIGQLVDAFNTATLSKKVRIVDIVISGASYYLFYSGDTLVQTFTFNCNDSERIFRDDKVYYVEYPDKTPYEMYSESPAEVIYVDAQFNELDIG